VFRRLFSLFVVFALVSVSAHATSRSGLKQAFDELNYALTVEWDQQDKDFHNAQLKKFSLKLNELKKEGLTNAELLTFIKKEVKDQRVGRDIETAFNMIQINKMSNDEASNYMIETMKKSYSAGASFNGEVFLYLGIGLLVVAAAIALAGSGGGSSSSSDDYYYDPGYTTTCYDSCYPQYYECGDFYYPSTCSTTVCDTICY